MFQDGFDATLMTLEGTFLKRDKICINLPTASCLNIVKCDAIMKVNIVLTVHTLTLIFIVFRLLNSSSSAGCVFTKKIDLKSRTKFVAID